MASFFRFDRREGPLRETTNKENSIDENAVEILCEIAEGVGAAECESIVINYRKEALAYEIVTSIRQRPGIQARVLRDLAEFRKFRGDLLLVMPQLSIVLPLSALSTSNPSDGLLELLPQRTLRRASTRMATGKNIVSASNSGTTQWHMAKVPVLTDWIASTLARLRPLLSNCQDNHEDAKLHLTSLLQAFFLRGAKLSL